MTGRWRYVALGALCGAAWGVVARLWMRLIATQPEFSWSGTLFIVGTATIPGIAMGGVLVRPSRWTRIAGRMSVAPLAIGPGMVMVPTFVLGGMAIARRRRQPRVAVALCAAAVVAAFVVVRPALGNGLPATRVAVGMALFLVLMAWLSAMLAVSLSPGRSKRSDHGDRSTGADVGRERLGPDRTPDADGGVAVGPAVDEPAGQHEVGAHQAR